MKKHIIALLAISTLALASCGTQKEAVADVPPPPPPVNPALEWRKSSEFEFINKQTFKYAADLLQRKLGSIKEGPVVFIDVPFLLLDQNTMNRYFDNNDRPLDLRIREAQEVSRFDYNQDALEFLRLCQESGVEVILMAEEQEVLPTVEDLATKNLVVMPSIYDGTPNYGKIGRNITMLEMAESNRIALILTTSLGEATSLTGMGRAINENMEELYRVHGDKLIVFPNPAFN